MSIVFRKANQSDKTRILRLLSNRQDESNQINEHRGNKVLEEGPEIFDEMLTNKNITIIVGEINKHIVATVTIYILPRVRLWGSFALFEDVLVAKEYRGQGIGKQLINFAIEECLKNKQIRKIKLGTRKNKEDLQAFYTSLGFEFKEKLMQRSLQKAN